MKTACEALLGSEKHEWGKCPICKEPWKFEEEWDIDSDNITPLAEEVEPEARATLSFYAAYHVYGCRACKGMFYFVDVAVVRNPNISEGWQHCFFWRNGGEGNYVTGETKILETGPVQGRITEKTPTTEGDFYRFILGPFIPKDLGLDEHGVRFFDWERGEKIAASCINNFSFLTDPAPPLK